MKCSLLPLIGGLCQILTMYSYSEWLVFPQNANLFAPTAHQIAVSEGTDRIAVS